MYHTIHTIVSWGQDPRVLCSWGLRRVATRWLTSQRGKHFLVLLPILPSYGSKMEPGVVWGRSGVAPRGLAGSATAFLSHCYIYDWEPSCLASPLWSVLGRIIPQVQGRKWPLLLTVANIRPLESHLQYSSLRLCWVRDMIVGLESFHLLQGNYCNCSNADFKSESGQHC